MSIALLRQQSVENYFLKTTYAVPTQTLASLPLKAAFIDRDGVINKEKNYLYKIAEFEFTDHCIDALRNITDAGYHIIVVTNQSGIGRGYYTEADYYKLTNWYVRELKARQITITAVFFCPHHPRATLAEYRKQCDCRKPKPGMILEAARKYGIDLSTSVMIGDKITDVHAGKAAGIGNNILVNNEQNSIMASTAKIPYYENLYQWSFTL